MMEFLIPFNTHTNWTPLLHEQDLHAAAQNTNFSIVNASHVGLSFHNKTTMSTSHNRDELDGENENYLYIFDLLSVRLTLLTLFTIVFLFCALGNLAVVLVTTLHHKMRNTTKFFLAHLAVANLCVGVFCIYQHLSMHLIQSWIFGTFLCKMYHFVISLSHTASVLILIVTVVERYCVIVYPFRSRWLLTMRRRHVIIAAVWLTSCVLSFHKFYYVTIIEHRLSRTDVEIFCAMDVTNFDHKLADLITFFLLFLIPMTIISVLYLRIVLVLRQRGTQPISLARDNIRLSRISRLNINGNNQEAIQPNAQFHEIRIRVSEAEETAEPTDGEPSTPSSTTELETQTNGSFVRSNGLPNGVNESSEIKNETERTLTSEECVEPEQPIAIQNSISNPARLHHAKRSAIKTLIMVAVCFGVCNLPFYVQKMLQNYFSLYESDNPWMELISPLCFLLMCVNCAVNPFLHALHNRKFQRCLREILKGKCRREFSRA